MLIALTRAVSPSIQQCELTTLSRVPIDFARAVAQHECYEAAVREAGCSVRRLPPLPAFPDAVFVEDAAVVVNELAVIARPGVDSRLAETASMADVLKDYRPLATIEAPGTLDGGDVLTLGKHVYVGLTTRTNRAGIEQLGTHLAPHGYEVTAVEIAGGLHLKSGVTELADCAILVNPDWVDPKVFAAKTVIRCDPEEPRGANVLRLGSTILYPVTYPKTAARLRGHGFEPVIVDMSELAKAEGALTCCSVVFEMP
jgi:dimethylargininase